MPVCGVHGPLAEAELDAWQRPATLAQSRDRAMLASMNQRKNEAWARFRFAHTDSIGFEVALCMLDTLFTRKDLGKDYHCALNLVRTRLLPSAKILPFETSSARH